MTCILALLAGLVTVLVQPAEAVAVAPGNARLATWNMQRQASYWSGRAIALARDSHVVALQEVPANAQNVPTAPAGAQQTTDRAPNAAFPPLPAGVTEYTWNLGTASRPEWRYVYLMQTANLPVGMVTAERMPRVLSVAAVNNARNALVVMDDAEHMAYASFHAGAHANNSAPEMVRNVADTVRIHGGAQWNWAVLGDFNREPGNLSSTQGIYNASVIHAGDDSRTQLMGGNLDYLVTNLPQHTWRAAVDRSGGSDHWPVVFGALHAEAYPDYTYRFRWNHWGQNVAIGVAGDSTTNDAVVEQSAWRHSLGQVWRATRFQVVGGEFYSQLENVHSGQCLDVVNGVSPTGAPMRMPIQRTCATGASVGDGQLWRYSTASLINAAGGQVMAAPEGGAERLEVSTRLALSAWSMEPVDLRYWNNSGFPDGDTVITDTSTSHSVRSEAGLHGDPAGGIFEGTLRDDAYAPLDEQWRFEPSGVPGGVHVVNNSTGLCLDLRLVTAGPDHPDGYTDGEPCSSGGRDQAWEYVNGTIRNIDGYVLGHGRDYDPAYMSLRADPDYTTSFSLSPAVWRPAHWAEKVPRLAVMPLGDSITLGVGSNTRTGYRPALAKQLGQDVKDVQFVGSQQDPDGTRHEGHSGWRIDQLQANIETWLADAKPNVVLLHIGTNDMNRNYQVSTAPQRLGKLIDQIHDASPDTAVVVASLVPATDPTVQARVNAYNKAIPKIVADRAQQGYPISQVSMGALTTADLNDNLHPNNNGYAKMTSAFLGGVVGTAGKGWIKAEVNVKPAPPSQNTTAGDYHVDINGDGRADYLVVDDNGATRAWLNTGPAKWSAQGYISSGSSNWTGGQVRFADIGGDNRADYLVLSPNGAVHAFINEGGDGHGGWKDAGTIATGSTNWTAAQVRFADIGGDAKADYLVLSPNGATRALVNTTTADGSIKWDDRGSVATGSDWTADQVRFADIGGDAKADYLIVDNNGATRALVNTTTAEGTLKWNNRGYIASGSADWIGSQIRFADIGGDAKADYLILDDNGGLTGYHNVTEADGTPAWDSQGVIAGGTGAPGYRVRI